MGKLVAEWGPAMLLLLGISGWFFFLPAMRGLCRLGTSSQSMFWELEQQHSCNLEDKEEQSMAGSRWGKKKPKQVAWRLPQSFWDRRWCRATSQAVLSEEVVSGSWYISTMLADTILLIVSELAFDPTGLHWFDFTLFVLGNLHGVWVHFPLTETGSACIEVLLGSMSIFPICKPVYSSSFTLNIWEHAIACLVLQIWTAYSV